MAGNPYRDQKGHLTTRANDGGPCYHDINKPQEQAAMPRQASEQARASKLLGTNLQEMQDEPIKITYVYNGKELKVKNTSTQKNNRIVELEDAAN